MNTEQVYSKAEKLAKKHGLINLTRRELCDALAIAPGSFTAQTGLTFEQVVGELRQRGVGSNVVSVNRSRTCPELRREHLLSAAVDISERDGFLNLSRGRLAEAAGVSKSLISHYFGDLVKLRRAVMRVAVKEKRLGIIAQGLATEDAEAKKAPLELRRKAARAIAQ